MGISTSASRLPVIAALVALMTACATDSVVVTGSARPAIAPAEVKIYWRPPPVFQEIAILNASKNSAFTTGGQKTVDKVIAGLESASSETGCERCDSARLLR